MLSKIVEVPWAKCKPDSAGRSKDVVQCPLVVGAEMPRGPDGKPAKPVDGRLPKPVGGKEQVVDVPGGHGAAIEIQKVRRGYAVRREQRSGAARAVAAAQPKRRTWEDHMEEARLAQEAEAKAKEAQKHSLDAARRVEKRPRPCLRTPLHARAWRLQGGRPLLRTLEHSLGSLEACRGRSGAPQPTRKTSVSPGSTTGGEQAVAARREAVEELWRKGQGPPRGDRREAGAPHLAGSSPGPRRVLRMRSCASLISPDLAIPRLDPALISLRPGRALGPGAHVRPYRGGGARHQDGHPRQSDDARRDVPRDRRRFVRLRLAGGVRPSVAADGAPPHVRLPALPHPGRSQIGARLPSASLACGAARRRSRDEVSALFAHMGVSDGKLECRTRKLQPSHPCPLPPPRPITPPL